MPVEVRELIIKATIEQDGGKNQKIVSSKDNSSGNEEIINACINKILEILNEKDGR